jgi:hypothetical protein
LKEVFRSKEGSFDLTPLKAWHKENEIEARKIDMEWRNRSLPHVRRSDAPQPCEKKGFVVSESKTITAPGEEAPSKAKNGCSGELEPP